MKHQGNVALMGVNTWAVLLAPGPWLCAWVPAGPASLLRAGGAGGAGGGGGGSSCVARWAHSGGPHLFVPSLENGAGLLSPFDLSLRCPPPLKSKELIVSPPPTY